MHQTADNTIIKISKSRKEHHIMVLKETERTAIENLRTQEKSCIEKYPKIRTAGDRSRT